MARHGKSPERGGVRGHRRGALPYPPSNGSSPDVSSDQKAAPRQHTARSNPPGPVAPGSTPTGQDNSRAAPPKRVPDRFATTLKALQKARDKFVTASGDENAIGLTAQQWARRREARNAAGKALTTIQHSYTRRVEAFLRRRAKVDPAEDREKTQRRIANALEHLVIGVYMMIKEPVPNLDEDSGEDEMEAGAPSDGDDFPLF